MINKIDWNNLPFEARLLAKDNFTTEDWAEFDRIVEQESYINSWDDSKRRYTPEQIVDIFSDDEETKKDIIKTLERNIKHYTSAMAKLDPSDDHRATLARSLVGRLGEMYLRFTGTFKRAIKENLINDYEYMKQQAKQVDIVSYMEGLGFKVVRNKLCCPLHNEKTPSMMLYPNTNSFNCFGCSTGGDLIEFLMKYEGITYNEALTKLN